MSTTTRQAGPAGEGKDAVSGQGEGSSRPYTPEELAYQQGLRDANVDSHLRLHDQSIRSHEQRLNAINGSIERHARNAEKLTHTVEALDEKLDVLIANQTTRDAVEADREEHAGDAEKKRLDRRTFLLGIWTIAVMLFVGMGGMVVALIASHH